MAQPRSPLHITDDGLADLRARLARTRYAQAWPTPDALPSWTTGTDAEELRRLVDHWADGYDWRAAEAGINALPWNTAHLDAAPLRYLKFDAERDGALPIVLTHGWPSTVLEMVALAQRLSAPSRHGGRAEDAFTVVVPALPGFPFSPQQPTVPAETPTHELWHRLMHDELGFTGYAAHGGDLGAGVTSLLGQAHPASVVGIHLLAVADPITYDPAGVTGEEQAHLDHVARWFADDGAYEHQQMTCPITLAHGLSDSPAGLLAWIVEKYRDWSDCDGVLSRRFSADTAAGPRSPRPPSSCCPATPPARRCCDASCRATRARSPASVSPPPHGRATRWRARRWTSWPAGSVRVSRSSRTCSTRSWWSSAAGCRSRRRCSSTSPGSTTRRW